MPSADRATSGYALKTGDSISLIDCGGGVCSSFLKCGLDPRQVDRVFVSHTHPDHCCELPLLIQMVYLAGRREPLDLFLPEEFVNPFRTYLRSVYLIIERMPFELKLTGYESGFRYTGPFELTAIGNLHLKGYADFVERLDLPNRMQCNSLQVVTEGRSLFYSSDITSLDEIKDHVRGADYLVVESTHIELESLPQMVDESGVKRIVLTHLGTDDEVAKIVERIRQSGPENVTIAYDGLVLPL